MSDRIQIAFDDPRRYNAGLTDPGRASGSEPTRDNH